MSDFLSNLIDTHLRGTNVLQPRLPSLFEPPPALGESPGGSVEVLQGAMPFEPRAFRSADWAPASPASGTPAGTPGGGGIGRETPVREKRADSIVSGPVARKDSGTQQGRNAVRTERREEVESVQTRSAVIQPEVRTIREAVLLREREAVPADSPSQARSVVGGRAPADSEMTSAAAGPVVNVSIGRVEVRVPGPAPEPRRPREDARVMGLEEYLRRRAGGEGR